MYFALVILVIVVCASVAGFLIWKKDWLANNPLKKIALLSAIFVPLMGVVSIFYAMMGTYNEWAVILGVILFILQWFFIFNSRQFQSRWQKTSFQIAFILNSVLRLPFSLYADPFIFMMQLSVYHAAFGMDSLFGSPVDGADSVSFFITLFLTLSHGVTVQVIYGLSLLILYAITLSGMKLIKQRSKSTHA